jgi:hypothetical protein
MAPLERIGRGIGALAGSAAGILWVYAIWFPSDTMSFSGASIGVAALMALFALFAVIASTRGHSGILFAMFLVSFLPIGAFLLYAAGWPRWIGILDVLLLLASFLIRRGAQRQSAVD